MRNAYCRTWNLERKQINVENETQTLHDLEYGEKTEKRGKWVMDTLNLDYGVKTENRGKLDTKTVWPGIRQENWKTCKMSNGNFRISNMERNTEKLRKWEMYTLGLGIVQEIGKNVKNETHKTRTWKMARKLKIMENETHTL